MSPTPTAPDIRRLRDEGYDVELTHGHLVIRDVPYVNPERVVRRGVLVTPVEYVGDVVAGSSDHRIWFAGERPCDSTGAQLGAVNTPVNLEIIPGLTVNYMFSAKPPGGYTDYHHKVVSYLRILGGPAHTIDPSATAMTFRTRQEADNDSPFVYPDTASSRAGIETVSAKLYGHRVAIVGVGGTGSYILDQVAKTPVAEIHLFDGDKFLNHNAYRAPGAAALTSLNQSPYKVDHFAAIYSNMHRGVRPHATFIDDSNVEELRGMDYVFLAADDDTARHLVRAFLSDARVPFVDVGMGVELVNGQLTGLVRTNVGSAPSPQNADAVPVGAGGEYSSNIQIAELNMLNAALAVLTWKRTLTFYANLGASPRTTYQISTGSLIETEEPE